MKKSSTLEINVLRRFVLVTAACLSVISLLLLVSCTLHKSLSGEDTISMPKTYSSNNATPAESSGKWWEQFGDDQLNHLINEAISNNPDITRAYARLRASEAVLKKTGAVRGVTADINASGGKTRQNGIFGTVRAETYSLSASARYELDLWNKLSASADAAMYDMLANEDALRTAIISITARVADLYFLAVEQRAQLALADKIIESFKDTLKRVEDRYYSGLVPAIDVYQSRQNLASAISRKSLFESNLSVTLNALAVLAGKFPGNASVGSSVHLPDGPIIKEGIPSQLLNTRPDIRAALSRLRAADRRIAAAVADRFPSFSVTASYGGSSDRVRSVFDDPNIFWNILMQAIQPIFDSGLRKAEVDRTKAVYTELIAAYHSTVLNAYSEVEDALSRIAATTDRVKALADVVIASNDSLRLAIERYMQGITDYLPVLTEQTRNFNARSDLLAAKRQLISDRISLARALGGTWSIEVANKYYSEKGKLNE